MSESKGERIGMTIGTVAYTVAAGALPSAIVSDGKTVETLLLAAEKLVFEGIQARYEGDASARALFSVSHETVKALEAQGNLVEFGYLLARAEDAESFDAMRLAYDEPSGEWKTSDGVTLKTVYRRGKALASSIEYETGKYAFAASLPELDPKDRGENALTERYRACAYLAVCDQNGERMTVLYRNAVSFVSGDTFSVLDASEYFLYAGYGASETFTHLFGEAAAEVARTHYDSYAECELLCTESRYRASVIERAHEGALAEKAALDEAVMHIGSGMSKEDALRYGTDAANARARALLYARTEVAAYTRAYADASTAKSLAAVLAEQAEATAMRAGARRDEAKAISHAISRRLLSMSEETLAFLDRAARKHAEMNALLSADASYTADQTVAAAFEGKKKSITLGENDLSDYLIVVTEKTEEAGALLSRLLIANAGISLGIYNHESGVLGEHFDYSSEKVITVGLTKARLPKAGRGYAVYAARNFLCLEGSDGEALETAIAVLAKQLCGNRLEEGETKLSLTLDGGALIEQPYEPLVIEAYRGEMVTLTNAVSLHELYAHEAFADYETAKKVVEVCGEYVPTTSEDRTPAGE